MSTMPSEVPDERPDEMDDLPAASHEVGEGVEPIPVAQFEGEFVTEMEAKLPAITLGLAEGYPRGTHLKLEVEVRVRNVRYEEIARGEHKGDLARVHVLALEQVQLLGAYTAQQLDPGVGGSASAAAYEGAGEQPEPPTLTSVPDPVEEAKEVDPEVGF